MARQLIKLVSMARPWTRAQDAIVRKHPPSEAARLTGHPLPSVYSRRFKLGLPDRRKTWRFDWTPAADKIVRDNPPPFTVTTKSQDQLGFSSCLGS